MFTQYEIANAASKIDGYYNMPSRRDPIDPGAEFDSAKAECIGHLRRALEAAEALTVEQFMEATKRGKLWAQHVAAQLADDEDQGAGNRQFVSDAGQFALRDLLAGNAEDSELCAWLRAAAVGDSFGGGAGATIKRVS